ncbi:hypothetical protein D3C75_583770 [compost metagenome]
MRLLKQAVHLGSKRGPCRIIPAQNARRTPGIRRHSLYTYRALPLEQPVNFLRPQIRTVIKSAEVPRLPRLPQFSLDNHPVSPLPSACNSDFRLRLELDLYSEEFALGSFTLIPVRSLIRAISLFARILLLPLSWFPGISQLPGIALLVLLYANCRPCRIRTRPVRPDPRQLHSKIHPIPIPFHGRDNYPYGSYIRFVQLCHGLPECQREQADISSVVPFPIEGGSNE